MFTLTIATAVTIADLYLKAFMPEMSASLGPYIPLIIVNCIIIGRAEACASKNGLAVSIIDALGMGAGFTITLCVLAGIREVLATGNIFDVPVLKAIESGGWFTPWAAMGMPVGAFITLGLMLGGVNLLSKKTG
jgi:electron transport complex protein RnfE